MKKLLIISFLLVLIISFLFSKSIDKFSNRFMTFAPFPQNINNFENLLTPCEVSGDSTSVDLNTCITECNNDDNCNYVYHKKRGEGNEQTINIHARELSLSTDGSLVFLNKNDIGCGGFTVHKKNGNSITNLVGRIVDSSIDENNILWGCNSYFHLFKMNLNSISPWIDVINTNNSNRRTPNIYISNIAAKGNDYLWCIGGPKERINSPGNDTVLAPHKYIGNYDMTAEQLFLKYDSEFIYLKSRNSEKNFSAQPNNTFHWDRDWERPWEKFKIIYPNQGRDGKVALQTYHGKYIKAHQNGNISVVDHVRGDEMFEMDAYGDYATFKSRFGTYLSSENQLDVKWNATSNTNTNTHIIIKGITSSDLSVRNEQPHPPKTFSIPGGYHIVEDYLDSYRSRAPDSLRTRKRYNYTNCDFFSHPDEFKIESNGHTSYIINRLDSNNGWGQRLMIAVNKHYVYFANKSNESQNTINWTRVPNLTASYIYAYSDQAYVVDLRGNVHKKIGNPNSNPGSWTQLSGIGNIRKVSVNNDYIFCMSKDNVLYVSRNVNNVSWTSLQTNVVDIDCNEDYIVYIKKDNHNVLNYIYLKDICKHSSRRCNNSISNNLNCSTQVCGYNKIDISRKSLNMIKNPKNNKCVQLNTNNLTLNDCNNNNKNQHFFTYNNKLRSPYSNRCLEARADLRNINITPCRNIDSQSFEFQNKKLVLSDELKNGDNNICVNANNNNIELANCVINDNNQEFDLVKPEDIGKINEKIYNISKGECVKKGLVNDNIPANIILKTPSYTVDKDLWRDCDTSMEDCLSYNKIRYGRGNTWKTKNAYGNLEISDKIFGEAPVSNSIYQYKDNETCRDICENDPSCQGFTETQTQCKMHGYGSDYTDNLNNDRGYRVIIDEGDNTTGKKCFKKVDFYDKLKDPNFSESVGRCSKLNMDLEPTTLDLEKTPPVSGNPRDCKQVCLNDKNCKGFEYIINSNECQYYTDRRTDRFDRDVKLPVFLSGEGDGNTNIKCYKNNTFEQKPFINGDYEVTYGGCVSNTPRTTLDSHIGSDSVDAGDTRSCNSICSSNVNCLGYTYNHNDQNCIYHGNAVEDDDFFTIRGNNPDRLKLSIFKGKQISLQDKNRCHKYRNRGFNKYKTMNFHVHEGECAPADGLSLPTSRIEDGSFRDCEARCKNNSNCQAFEYEADSIDNQNTATNINNRCKMFYNPTSTNYVFKGDYNSATQNKVCLIKKTN